MTMIELFIVIILSTGQWHYMSHLDDACNWAKEDSTATVYHLKLSDVPSVEKIKCKFVGATKDHWEYEAVPQTIPATIILPQWQSYQNNLVPAIGIAQP